MNSLSLTFLLLTVFFFTDAAALEMSSKRDCVVCHIMWLDDFRTDKETLVDWQPGNVLMKDTQGVVSSEEICYSCHDGYVMDSRNITWKYNRHKTYVKPSNQVRIPNDLPLSAKGEIYCGTCHSAHGKGASPHGDPFGRTSLFRERNVDSSLCQKCHINKAAYKDYNGHPIHTNTMKLPEKLFSLGSTHAGDRNEVICQTCHRVHGARGNKLLIIDNSNSDLCIICHDQQKALMGTKHDLRVTLPDEKNIKDETLSESGPCGACHTPHQAAGQKLWAKRLKPGNPASQLCLTCHGEDTHYETKRIGTYTHPINVELSPLENSEVGLPLFADNGKKSRKGKVQCFSCHNAHQWNPESVTDKGEKDGEGDSTNSFLRQSNSSSGLCLECHADKKQVLTSDHNLQVTAPEEKNQQGFNAAQAGPCGVCHIPHNALAPRLWSKDLSGDRDMVTQYCTACHDEKGSAREKLIGENYHPVDVSLANFAISTSLPLYDGDGNRTPDGKLVCVTCHDPHVWDPLYPVADYASKNMEGDATNSFLRKPNFPSSDLCKSCHAEKALVDGTDHDLHVTAPEAKNFLGQTVSQSGPCGACHLVHNSPNMMKLWARSYGEIVPGEDVIDSLCTGCHQKGSIAEQKIPLIATHPSDRLINNIMRSDRNALDYAPIFDKKTGEKVHVGNISCPSCHNAHQWSPLDKEKGKSQNIEGNATNSFLRNVSYNNICIDCHGLDALFRYKYYHDPDERVESRPGGVKIIK